MTASLYPSEDLRKRLEELGVPRDKHNLAELGEMLFEPEQQTNKYYPNAFRTRFKEKAKRWVIGNAYPLVKGDWLKHASTQADCYAKMLIYLKEKGLIK